MPKAVIPQWIVLLLDNLNIEDFISYIEIEPPIWDASTPEYSNNVETEKSWRNVCLKLDPDFESRPPKEKNSLGKSLHRRWKSLRDCYTRELKRQKTQISGAAASMRKPYIYFEQLRFLEPVLCSTESNVEVQEDVLETSGIEDDQVTTDIAEEPQYPQPSRSKKRKTQEDLLVEVLKKKIVDKSKSDKPADDADSMFLSSLLPELKKIPENHKLFVKSQIVNTILGVQTTLNIASIPALSHPLYHQNNPTPHFYPQQYEMPSTSNYKQSHNTLLNHNLYQPPPTFTNANYTNLEPPVQRNMGNPLTLSDSGLLLMQQSKNVNKTPPHLSPKRNSSATACKTSPSVINNSQFSMDRNETQMSDDDINGDFPFWKS